MPTNIGLLVLWPQWRVGARCLSVLLPDLNIFLKKKKNKTKRTEKSEKILQSVFMQSFCTLNRGPMGKRWWTKDGQSEQSSNSPAMVLCPAATSFSNALRRFCASSCRCSEVARNACSSSCNCSSCVSLSLVCSWLPFKASFVILFRNCNCFNSLAASSEIIFFCRVASLRDASCSFANCSNWVFFSSTACRCFSSNAFKAACATSNACCSSWMRRAAPLASLLCCFSASSKAVRSASSSSCNVCVRVWLSCSACACSSIDEACASVCTSTTCACSSALSCSACAFWKKAPVKNDSIRLYVLYIEQHYWSHDVKYGTSITSHLRMRVFFGCRGTLHLRQLLFQCFQTISIPGCLLLRRLYG